MSQDDKIVLSALDPKTIKLAKDPYWDARHQGGDAPGDLGEHLPIDEEAVVIEVVVAQIKQEGDNS